MTREIVSSLEPVTLIGGGEVDLTDLATALALAETLVAADGGAALALDAGVMPVAVIGDFDSLSASDQDRIPASALFRIREQNSTDFDKALRNICAPVVVAVGFLGARVDHQLAAFNTLACHPDRLCVLLGRHELVFHLPRQIELPLSAGDVVSLFPMSEVTGRSRGLEWPIDGLQFATDQRVGTSNRATGPVNLEMESPGMLAMVPRRALVATVQALRQLSEPARWPARAG